MFYLWENAARGKKYDEKCHTVCAYTSYKTDNSSQHLSEPIRENSAVMKAISSDPLNHMLPIVSMLVMMCRSVLTSHLVLSCQSWQHIIVLLNTVKNIILVCIQIVWWENYMLSRQLTKTHPVRWTNYCVYFHYKQTVVWLLQSHTSPSSIGTAEADAGCIITS